MLMNTCELIKRSCKEDRTSSQTLSSHGLLKMVKFLRLFDSFSKSLFKPCDPSSLGITRFLFGLLMMVDIAEERGGGEVDIRWGEPRDCHFPLIPNLKPLTFPYMSLLYGIMWLGALGIAVGFKFRTSCLMFCAPYWYILLLDTSFWNNHSYLYGLLSVLFLGSSAQYFWSIDGLLDKSKRNKDVPYWNYFVLKFQIFVLYFFAGLKKIDLEWLTGYSMANLGMHWVFDPLKVILTGAQIDYIIVHWFGFLLDLTVGFLLMCGKTRPIGIAFCSSFHLMNSRLFSIGMFPYVCLVTMPLFCEANWPKKLCRLAWPPKTNEACLYAKEKTDKDEEALSPLNAKQKVITSSIMIYCFLQAFLPYSHFITKGYNNWTNGLYGYSWDMMIHSWDTNLVVVRVVDNLTGREHFLDPSAWTENDRWSKHADMCFQYAKCLKENFLLDLKNEKASSKNSPKSISKFLTSDNFSIYIDVWCSLNGRFQQRMYDPNYDLLKASWSPFKPVEWLLPLLTEYSGYRTVLTDIEQHVFSWSNYSDVVFIADFPGLSLENYISPDLGNVTLTILEGEVVYTDDDLEEDDKEKIKLGKGDHAKIPSGVFHKISTISSVPSCYMYTYFNKTKEALKEDDHPGNSSARSMISPFPLLEDRRHLFEGSGRMLAFVANAILNILYDVPMVRRARVH